MTHRYILKNIRVLNHTEFYNADIDISAGRVQEIGTGIQGNGRHVIDGEGLIACPGLINSHDHLQFNLYSRIGAPPYNNAYEWGKDILSRCQSTVKTIESISLRDRYLWGAWKNLFSGVTLVAHHDPLSLHFLLGFPIDVLRRFTFAHSLGNEPQLQNKLERRKVATPFMIHLGEGKDDRASSEVQSLYALGGLDPRTVAIHAVGITRADVELLKEANASIVWCPSSNLFLFGKTAPIDALWGNVRTALGTDSTLTGETTLFHEMRIAKRNSSLTAKDIFSLTTELPRSILGLPEDAGKILVGGRANMFLIRQTADDPFQSVLQANPEDILLLFRNGRPVFHDAVAFPQLGDGRSERTLVWGGGVVKYIHARQCIRLVRRLRPYLGHYSYLSLN